jgi:hypothetical protein
MTSASTPKLRCQLVALSSHRQVTTHTDKVRAQFPNDAAVTSPLRRAIPRARFHQSRRNTLEAQANVAIRQNVNRTIKNHAQTSPLPFATNKSKGMQHMKNARISASIAVAFVAAAAWSQAPGRTPVVTIFAAPAAVDISYVVLRGTYATGISSKGDVVGNFYDACCAHVSHGFIRTLDGTLTTVNWNPSFPFPGYPEGTFLEGINTQGVAVGYYIRRNRDHGDGAVYHGLIRSPQGVITTIDLPGAGTGDEQGTFLEDINNSGTILGGYIDSFGERHFVLLSKKGEVTKFEVPGSSGTRAYYVINSIGADKLNSAGEASGTYRDSDDVRHGWVRSKQGMVTVFDASGAGAAANQGTIASGINEEGAISGATIDENNVQHGMIRDRNGNFTVFDAPGAANGGGTSVASLNASNTAVGNYWDATGKSYGFVRTADGTFTNFDLSLPGTSRTYGTYVTGINNQGWLTGWFRDNEDYGDRSFVIIP